MRHSLSYLLRYHSRHSLYRHPTEAGGRWQLNPISSRHDGTQQSIEEPAWLHRLRRRLCAVEQHQCPNAQGARRLPGRPDHDTWDLGADGCRTCSYCGSMHFEDLISICRVVPHDERYAVEPSDKGYKTYVRQPDVINASEGAIKFYMWHVPQPPSEEHQELYRIACRVSRERFSRQMEEMRARRSVA